MGSIVATEYVSLDGVVQAPGGFEDFEHAGWVFETSRGEEGEKFKLDETLALDGGRVRGQVQLHAQVCRLVDPQRAP